MERYLKETEITKILKGNIHLKHSSDNTAKLIKFILKHSLKHVYCLTLEGVEDTSGASNHYHFIIPYPTETTIKHKRDDMTKTFKQADKKLLKQLQFIEAKPNSKTGKYDMTEYEENKIQHSYLLKFQNIDIDKSKTLFYLGYLKKDLKKFQKDYNDLLNRKQEIIKKAKLKRQKEKRTFLQTLEKKLIEHISKTKISHYIKTDKEEKIELPSDTILLDWIFDYYLSIPNTRLNPKTIEDTILHLKLKYDHEFQNSIKNKILYNINGL